MDMPRESLELMSTLAGADPDARTACSQWTVHDLVAHLAAGAKENADLIEDALAGRPARETRSFAEREPAFAAMPDDQLRQELVHQSSANLLRCRSLPPGDQMRRISSPAGLSPPPLLEPTVAAKPQSTAGTSRVTTRPAWNCSQRQI